VKSSTVADGSVRGSRLGNEAHRTVLSRAVPSPRTELPSDVLPGAVPAQGPVAVPPGPDAEPEMWDRLLSQARCADSGLDPDEWYPISTDAAIARQEAVRAIAVCRACPVRGLCMTMSLLHWDIGQHGIWGGMVPADRAELRRRLGVSRGTAPASLTPASLASAASSPG
jgi:Transcription factor WhiB